MCHQVETREDEEQSVKLAEILELLLAAGYFRARIKGLSPFDKVHRTSLFIHTSPSNRAWTYKTMKNVTFSVSIALRNTHKH